MIRFRQAAALFLLAALSISLPACGKKDEKAETGHSVSIDSHTNVIELNGHSATLDGEAVEEFDYTWHCDPSTAHDEVKDAPAEYYTGEKPETDAAVYIDSELYYYPALPQDGFKLVNYDGEQEWAYYYTDGENDDYIFATLPKLGAAFPEDMMHSETEAAENRVLHITKPGAYFLQGEWNGQIRVELGDKDEVFADENAKISLTFSGANINCTVAPGVLIASAYECDNEWESRDAQSAEVDLSSVGVSIILDGTNTVSGKNVFRMLKTKYKDENSDAEIKTQKKLRKTDAAFYSYVSMSVEGDGDLTVNSGFEGLDSELHLGIFGGNITINSQDDGVNVNEDNVSVFQMNGGTLTLNAGQGAEGDGVDSNGFIALNGGTIYVNGITPPDSALDSEDGVYYSGGTVIIDGEEQDLEPGSVMNEIGGMGGMMPPGGFGGGDRLEMPGGENPPAKPDGEFGERPPMPGEIGTEPPEMPNGTPPEFPGGERPEKPNT